MAMYTAGRPPVLSPQEVALIVTKYFKFSEVCEDTYEHLTSYCDRNFFFEGKREEEVERGRKFILKVANPVSTSCEAVEGIVRVMKHLNSRGLLTPRPLSSRTGKDVIQLTSADFSIADAGCEADEKSMKYPVYIVAFIPGKLFTHVDKKHISPALLSEIGEQIGKLDRELMENFPSQSFVSEISEDWDMINLHKLKRYLTDIKNPRNRDNAERVINAFEEHVSPKIPSLRRAIIHADIHGTNVILKEDGDCFHLAGFIDFNDCIETCLVFELGISVAHFMKDNLQPVTCSNAVEFVAPLIQAYNRVLPLSAEELHCLYYLVLARCVLVGINSSRNFAAEPWNAHIGLVANNVNRWKLVDYLLSVPKQEVDRIWS